MTQQPPLFGDLTCPACGITEVNDFVLNLNHGDPQRRESGQCSGQHRVTMQLQGAEKFGTEHVSRVSATARRYGLNPAPH